MPIQAVFSPEQAWELLFTRLDAIQAQLDRIEQAGVSEMAIMDDLEAKVGQLTTVVDSENALLQLVHDELVAARGDPARVQAVIDTLETRRQEMLAAVAANTDGPSGP